MTFSPHLSRSYFLLFKKTLTYIAENCIFVSVVNVYKPAKFKTNWRRSLQNAKTIVDLMWNDPRALSCYW